MKSLTKPQAIEDQDLKPDKIRFTASVFKCWVLSEIVRITERSVIESLCPDVAASQRKCTFSFGIQNLRAKWKKTAAGW